jgi:hypothetical protein
MTTISTPDDVISGLVGIREQADRGIDSLYEAEVKMARLELEADRIWAFAIINAQGTQLHKEAVAKLKSAEARLEASIAKAEYQRLRTHLRQLELAQSNLQTQARMVEITWRTAGIGER